MKIFWSWQSDTHQPSGRHFVREILTEIADALNETVEANEADRPEAEDDDDDDGSRIHIDHDTSGVGGSPPIAATILGKIREAAVFVADVTPVAQARNGKRFPNPNVMIELGYALNVLGPERIVLVMNTAEGAAPRHLPFDLRHWRWPVTYTLAREADEAQKARAAGSLRESLRERIEPSLKRAKQDIAEQRRLLQREPKLRMAFNPKQRGPERLSKNDTDRSVRSLAEVRRATPLLTDSAASKLRFPLIAANSEAIERYNKEVEEYYDRYMSFIHEHAAYRIVQKKTFSAKVRLLNEGTSPATSVDVDIRFPNDIWLYEDQDELPREPEPPSEPLDRLMGVGGPKIMKGLFPKSRDVHTSVYPEDARVHFQCSNIKHNDYIELRTFFFSFPLHSDVYPFDVTYEITANEPVDPIRGSLRFAFSNGQDQ